MFKLILPILFALNAKAALVSTIPSTYKDTGIPNSHKVNKNVIRGMAPQKEEDIEKLISLGVSDFLIFKNDTNGEVQKEIDLLEEKGISKKNISQYDFPWKDITDFRSICEMTMDALKTIEVADQNNRKIYFHCTVGEDRTGYLAGLYKIYSENKSVDEVFVSEMCDKGYEAGDPKKPMSVVAKVRESLTPAFLTMAKIVQTAAKSGNGLSKKLCIENFNAQNWKDYKCKTSRLIH